MDVLTVQGGFELLLVDVALAMGRDVGVWEREMLAYMFDAGRMWELGPGSFKLMELVK